MLNDLIEAAKEFERAGAWDDALAAYEEALRGSVVEGSAATASDLLRWIGSVHRIRADLELAVEVYEVSLAVAELNHLEPQIAAVLNCLAVVAHLRGNVDEAADLYGRALAQAESLGDQRLAAMLDQNLGALHGLRGDLPEALSSYESALARSRLLADDRIASHALNNMGKAYLALGNQAEAELCFTRALALAESTGDRLLIGTLELNRAELHLRGGCYENARDCCDRSIAVFGRLKSKRWTAEAYKLYGILHREARQPERADAYFAMALGLAEVTENRLLQAEAQMEWAVVHLGAGRHRQGIGYLNKALRLFTEMQARREVLDIRERLETVEGLYLPAIQQWSTELLASTWPGQTEHAARVADLSCLLAAELGMASWERMVIRVGALIHDIGYTALSSSLNPHSEIAPEAHPLLRVHAIAGHALAQRLDFPEEVQLIVRHHHEQFDGAGFPDQLRAEAIPLPARIVAIADAFDRLRHPAGKRPALPVEEALAQLYAQARRVLDPELVGAFGRTIRSGLPQSGAA